MIVSLMPFARSVGTRTAQFTPTHGTTALGYCLAQVGARSRVLLRQPMGARVKHCNLPLETWNRLEVLEQVAAVEKASKAFCNQLMARAWATAAVATLPGIFCRGNGTDFPRPCPSSNKALRSAGKPTSTSTRAGPPARTR